MNDVHASFRPSSAQAAPASPSNHIEPDGQTQDAGHAQTSESLWHSRRLRRMLWALLLLSVMSFSLWWLRYRPYLTTEDARVAAPTVAVAVQGAGGRIERVHVREGQRVHAGDALLELDARAQQAQLERARALLDLAEARVGEAQTQLQLERQLWQADGERARANLRSARAVHQRTVQGARAEDIARARADVAAAEAVAAESERDLTRLKALWRDGAAAAADLERARASQAVAQASLQARHAALSLLEHGSRREDISASQGGVLTAKAGVSEAEAGAERVTLRARQLEEARAQAAQARAERSLAEIALDHMTLRSPVDGAVVRVSVDPGEHLSPGQGAVTIVDMDHAWIAANIEETASGALSPGQPVRISIDEGGELRGHLDVVTQAAAAQFALIPAENAAGNFTKVVQRIPVRIALDDSPRITSLRVGQSVEISIKVR